MEKSVQAIHEINIIASELGQKKAALISSERRGERKIGKAAVIGMLEMQIGLTTDMIAIAKEGPTFESWFANFKKWNTPRNWERMGLRNEGRNLHKRMMAEGDFEAYYAKEVVPMLAAVKDMEISVGQLTEMLESIKRTKV